MMDSYMDIREQCCGHRARRPIVNASDPSFSRSWEASTYPYFPLFPMDQMFNPEPAPETPSAAPSTSGGAATGNALGCPNSQAGPFEQQFPVAMAYVPWQQWQTTYSPERGLVQGTIFPDLDLKFAFGGCSK